MKPLFSSQIVECQDSYYLRVGYLLGVAWYKAYQDEHGEVKVFVELDEVMSAWLEKEYRSMEND